MYRGTIIDNKDPMNMGRVKVRVRPHYDGINEEHVPWAELTNPVSDGVGMPVIPPVGAEVWVIYEEGDHRHPVVIAVSPAIKNDTPDLPRAAYSEDPDMSNTIASNRKTGVQTASKGVWDEPEYTSNPDYPNNHVWSTKHHIIEMDDSQERIHIYHKSGSREEYKSDGSKVDHSKDRYVVSDNKKELVDGVLLLTITGDGDILINGKLTLKVDGDGNIEIKGKATIQSGGDIDVSAGGNVNITGGTINLN